MTMKLRKKAANKCSEEQDSALLLSNEYSLLVAFCKCLNNFDFFLHIQAYFFYFCRNWLQMH